MGANRSIMALKVVYITWKPLLDELYEEVKLFSMFFCELSSFHTLDKVTSTLSPNGSREL